MTKGKGKQRKRIRKRDWDPVNDADSASREPRRVRGRETGVSAPVEAAFDPELCFTDTETNAVVVSPYGVLAFVDTGEAEVLCHVHESLTDGKTSVLAPGDRVRVETDGEVPWVTAVARRRTALSRPAIGKHRPQVFAANVDQLMVVASCQKPAFRPGLVDRYLIAADMGGVSTALCINKMDLAEDEPEAAAVYRELGIPVVCTSCATGEGMDVVERLLRGKLTILAGQSGVGKTSIINRLDPSLGLAIREISTLTRKGKHTTTTSRIYTIKGDIRLVDTPGIRQLGLWGISKDEVDVYLPEIGREAESCRFRDCTHTREPGCAVRAAAEEGRISPLRYASYLRIRNDLESS
jgi:ribosome biogenesis GTPase / thiamine phosphate phosphatase